jgi:hypothetical protein
MSTSYEDLIERYESGQPARNDQEQAEYDHLAACADEAEDPQAADDWTPDTSRGLPAEIGSAIGDALPWLEAREREARAASDAEARGGRGPSASYAEWAAEGTTPAGPQPDGPEAGT